MQKVKFKDATLICCRGYICLFDNKENSIASFSVHSFKEVPAYSEGIHRNVHITLWYYKNRLEIVSVHRADKVSLFDGIFERVM